MRRTVLAAVAALGMSCLAVAGAGGTASPAAAAATPSAGTFHLVARTVLADTRTGLDTDRRALAAGETRRFAVAGRAGVPDDGAVSVLVQVTAEHPAHATSLLVWDPTARPHVAPMAAPAATAATTTLPVGLNHGDIAVTNGPSATHVRLVVEGWWSAPGGPAGVQLAPVPPNLVLDATVKPGSPATLDLFRTHRVALSPSALLVTMTAAAATGPGTVTLAPSSGTASGYPEDASVVPGQPTTQTSLVAVGTSYESIVVHTTAPSVRVQLWISGEAGTESAAVVPDAVWRLHPVRVFDTRNATSTAATPVAAGQPRDFQLGGMFGVPDDHVGAVVTTVTVTARSASASVGVAPKGAVETADAPTTAVRGRPVTSTRLVRLGASGRLTVSSTGSADVEVDVLGWVTARALLVPSLQLHPTDSVTLDQSPSGLVDPVVSPDAETAYAPDVGAPLLRRFDLRHGIELAPIPLAGAATGIDLLPGGGSALVVEPSPITNVRPGDFQSSVRLEQVTLATGARTTVPGPAGLNADDVVRMSDGTLLFAPPGEHIAASATRTVAWRSGVYAPSGRWDVTDRTWLFGLGGQNLHLNDDGTVVAVAPDAVLQHPLDGPQQQLGVPQGWPPGSCLLALSADGTTAFHDGGGTLDAVDIATASVRARAPMPDAPASPYPPFCGGVAVAPDGATVVITSDHGLSVVDTR